jgi:hypothetical protein
MPAKRLRVSAFEVGTPSKERKREMDSNVVLAAKIPQGGNKRIAREDDEDDDEEEEDDNRKLSYDSDEEEDDENEDNDSDGEEEENGNESEEQEDDNEDGNELQKVVKEEANEAAVDAKTKKQIKQKIVELTLLVIELHGKEDEREKQKALVEQINTLQATFNLLEKVEVKSATEVHTSWDKKYPTEDKMIALKVDGSNLERCLREWAMQWKNAYSIPQKHWGTALLRIQRAGSTHLAVMTKIVNKKPSDWTYITKELRKAYGQHNTLFEAIQRFNALKKYKHQTVLQFIGSYEEAVLDCSMDLGAPTTAYQFVHKLDADLRKAVMAVAMQRKGGQYTLNEVKVWAKGIEDQNQMDNMNESSKEKMVCWSCGRMGHTANYCNMRSTTYSKEEKKKSEGELGRQCTRCNKRGHEEKECWTRVDLKCDNCGMIGHESKYCRRVKSPTMGGTSTWIPRGGPTRFNGTRMTTPIQEPVSQKFGIEKGQLGTPKNNNIHYQRMSLVGQLNEVKEKDESS